MTTTRRARVLLTGTLLLTAAPSVPTADAHVAASCDARWRRLPGVSGEFLGIAAISSTDVWVAGDADFGPLVAHWDGTGWSRDALGTSGFLTAVDALGPDDVWAVGSGGTSGLTYHWDGSSWTEMPAAAVDAEEISLNDVHTVAADDVWAVGSYFDDELGRTGGLIEHWDGSAWTLVSRRPGAEFTAVDGRAADDVWAVGVVDGGKAYAQHWDGVAWRNVSPVPSTRRATLFRSVAAIGSSDVWAVGRSEPPDNATSLAPRVLAARWDGGEWRPLAVPHVPNHPDRSSLNSIVANGPDDIWTAGFLDDRPVTMHWDGASWRIVPPGAPLAELSRSPDGQLWALGPTDRSFVMHLCSTPPASADLWASGPPRGFWLGWRVGRRTTIPFQIWNAGSETVRRAGVTITVPDSMRFFDARSTRASCSLLDRHPALIQCDIGNVRPDEVVRIPVVVDILSPSPHRVTLRAAGLNDTYEADDAVVASAPIRGQACTIIGTTRDDTLSGTNGSDVLCGLGGDDRLSGGHGDDTLLGGPGPDVLLGGRGDDTIDGGPGWDRCSQGPGSGHVASCHA